MQRGEEVLKTGGNAQSPEDAKIPDPVKQRTVARIQDVAAEEFPGRYVRLDIRFRGRFCYIDAYTDPEDEGPDWPPANWRGSREEYLERMRATPTHLCRLRYTGDEDAWEFAFFASSNNKYERSIYPSGEPLGTPEEAFRVSAGVYLSES
jgi:hypothetical protein